MLIIYSLFKFGNAASQWPYDYYGGPYSVTFSAGITTASFRITINDDRYLELTDEVFSLTINDLLLPKHITYGNLERATVTIVSNESKCYAFLYVVVHIRSYTIV